MRFRGCMRWKYFILFLGFLAIQLPARASLNFDCWEKESPVGGWFDYCDGYLSFHSCAEPAWLGRVECYYFYHGSIIGQGREVGKPYYFIASPQACTAEIFSNKGTWKSAISRRDLVPLIWTRWHTKYWGFYFYQ